MLACFSSLPQENTSIKRQGPPPSCLSPRPRVQRPAWESEGRKLETQPSSDSRASAPDTPGPGSPGLPPPAPSHTPPSPGLQCPVLPPCRRLPNIRHSTIALPPSVSWGPVQLADNTCSSRSERASKRNLTHLSVLPAPRTSPSGNRPLCPLRRSTLPHP